MYLCGKAIHVSRPEDKALKQALSSHLRITPHVVEMQQRTAFLDRWSLALIGNASGQTFWAEGISNRGVFDKETRRKPLAFAADAVRYGI